MLKARAGRGSHALCAGVLPRPRSGELRRRRHARPRGAAARRWTSSPSATDRVRTARLVRRRRRSLSAGAVRMAAPTAGPPGRAGALRSGVASSAFVSTGLFRTFNRPTARTHCRDVADGRARFLPGQLPPPRRAAGVNLVRGEVRLPAPGRGAGRSRRVRGGARAAEVRVRPGPGARADVGGAPLPPPLLPQSVSCAAAASAHSPRTRDVQQ